MPLLQASQDGLTPINVIRVCLNDHRQQHQRPEIPRESETHASKHDVALGRLLLKQSPILEGPYDSLDPDRREQGDLGRIANEGGDLRVGSSATLEKALEDGTPNVA